MNSEQGRETLAIAEWHILTADRLVAQQRLIIARMARLGISTRAAEELLTELEKTKASFVADLDRLRALVSGVL